jgi:hypothetical protein
MNLMTSILVASFALLTGCDAEKAATEKPKAADVFFGSLTPHKWNAEAHLKMTHERTVVLRYSERKLSWEGRSIVETETASYVNGILESKNVEMIAVHFSPEVKLGEAMTVVDRLRTTKARMIVVNGEF